MRKIELGSIRMSKPLGAIAPPLKSSVPLLHGGCTVLSIQPSTSILSEKALAALKYAFLQNKKVGIAGVRVDSLKPPCDSDLKKAEAAYSIARELVEWSEQFIIDDEPPRPQDDQACLETQDDHKMNDKDTGYCIDSKDDTAFPLKLKMSDLKDPEIKLEIKDPEIKLEMFSELKEIEACSKLPNFQNSFDWMPLKSESVTYPNFSGNSASACFTATAETLDNFLGCDGFDFFKSDDMDINGFLSVSSIDSMDSPNDLIQPLDFGLAIPVPPLPTVFSKIDSDPELSVASPQSPFLFSPISTSPHSPFLNFPDS